MFTKGDNKLYVYRRSNPLYGLETEEGYYFSSLKEGLENIKKEKEKVKEVPENKIYVLENGKLVKTIKVKHKPIPAKVSVNTNWESYGIRNYSANNDYLKSYRDYNFYGDDDLEDDDLKSFETMQDYSTFIYELYCDASNRGFTEEEAEKLLELYNKLNQMSYDYYY
jgi:hypothetical protein